MTKQLVKQHFSIIWSISRSIRTLIFAEIILPIFSPLNSYTFRKRSSKYYQDYDKRLKRIVTDFLNRRLRHISTIMEHIIYLYRSFYAL